MSRVYKVQWKKIYNRGRKKIVIITKRILKAAPFSIWGCLIIIEGDNVGHTQNLDDGLLSEMFHDSDDLGLKQFCACKNKYYVGHICARS